MSEMGKDFLKLIFDLGQMSKANGNSGCATRHDAAAPFLAITPRLRCVSLGIPACYVLLKLLILI